MTSALWIAVLITCAPAEGLVAQGLTLPGTSQQADTVTLQIEQGTPPGPIPLDRIPTRLEQDLDRLQQIKHDTERDEGFQQIRENFYELVSGTDAILDRFESVSLPTLHSADLRNYRNSLERERGRLTQRGDNLERRFRTLEANRHDLDRIRVEWALTEDALGLDTVSAPSFGSAVARIRVAADSASAGLDARLLELLEAGEELARVGGRVDAALDEIQAALATHRRQLLIRDAPPLWRPVAVLSADRPWLGDAGAYLAADARAFTESLKADRDRVLLHLLVFILVLIAFLWLRKRSTEWPEDPELETARFMLSRPYSAAALTALLASAWIYPHASFLVVDVVLVLSMIPVLRLLPPRMLMERKKAVYWLLVLFLASRLVAMLVPGTRVHRLAILTLGVATSLWALGMVRLSQSDRQGLITGGWLRAVGVASRTALGLAAFGVVLNVAGWANLSEVLIRGVIPSAYLAIVVSLAATLLIGLARGIASSPLLRRSRAFRDNEPALLRMFSTLVTFVAVAVWAWATLAWFGSEQELFSRIRALLTHEFSIGALEISIGRVLLFFLILWVATRIGRIVRAVLRDDLLPGMSVSPGQADAWATLAQWAILVVGFLFAAAAAGIGGGQLAVLAGALGVGIGFGLQNIVNNFVSGFILIFEQPIKVGDTIEISSLSLLGEVRRIGIRSSTIHTYDGADVVVPNSNLIQSEVINWTLSDTKRRFEVPVGVKYGTDPQRVIDLLLEVARRSPRVLEHPAPVALFTGFGDSSLNFVLRMWSATFDDSIRLRSEVGVLVNDALKAEGIEIPFPQRDLHLRSVSQDAGRGLTGMADRGVSPGAAPDSAAARPGDPDATPDSRKATGSPD